MDELNINNIDLNRLKLFVEIVKSGNISKAAQSLNLQKSKISRDLALLESELGVQLVYRTTRKFSLTPEGGELFDKANAILESLSQALTRASAGSKKVAGSISITCPEDIGQMVVLPLLEKFSEIYPDVKIRLVFSSQIVDLLAERMDMAIRVGHLKDSTLRLIKLGQIEMGLYCSPKFFEKNFKNSSIYKISELSILNFEGSKSRNFWNLESTKDKRKFNFDPILTVNSYTALLSATLSGMGLALLPQFIVKRDLEKGDLIRVFKDWRSDQAPIQIVYPKKNEEIIRFKVFAEYISKNTKYIFTAS